jgi:hypothetical protein
MQGLTTVRLWMAFPAVIPFVFGPRGLAWRRSKRRASLLYCNELAPKQEQENKGKRATHQRVE